MSQTASLIYLTEGSSSNDITVGSVTLNGTVVSGSTSLLEQGSPSDGAVFNGIATNIASNNYFVTGIFGSTSVIFRETFGVTANFTSSAIVASDKNAGSEIEGLSVDSANNILYYADGINIYADRFGSSFSNTPTQVQIGVLPTIGQPHVAHGVAYDQAESALYVGGNTTTGTIGFTNTSVNLHANYIYKISVTPTMGASTTTTFSTSAIAGGGGVPFADGAVSAIALDTANDSLYFVTDPIADEPANDVGGVYALKNGVITKVWNATYGSTFTSPLTDITSISVDPLTGDYYLTGENNNTGEIYSGNINSSTAPVAMLSTNVTTNGENGGAVATAAAVVDPPSISSIAVSKVNGTTATTGTVTTAGTVTIAVNFTQTVNVTGTPTLTLNDGGTASYSSGSGTSTLLFTYTASLGQNTAALAVTGVSTSGGTLKDAAGITANISTSTVTFTGVVVETTPISITLSSTGADAVQGGAAINVLSGTPTITAANSTLVNATIALSNFQTGDVLGITGSTSGTLDSGKITYTSSNGTLSLSGTDSVAAYDTALGEITYQDNGTDSSSGAHPSRTLTWHVSDGVLSATGSATSITIDRAPSIVGGGAHNSLVAGGSISGGAALTGDSDLDGDSLTISAVSGGAVGAALSGTYGVLTLSANGTYSYSASNSAAIAAAATGSAPVDHFTFTVADGKGGTALETLAITIDRVPSIVSGGATASLVAGGTATGTALTGDSDPDGNSLTISAVSGGVVGTGLSGTYGVLTLSANGTYSYSASNTAAIAAAATGSAPVDHFTFSVSDGNGGVSTETLAVTIDRAPIIVSGGDQISLLAGGTSTGTALAGDSDPDGDSLTITSLSGGVVGTGLSGTYGVLTLSANGSYSYSANNNSAIAAAATGSAPVDHFTFSVSDGKGGVSTETLAITIDRAPIIVSGGDQISLLAGGTSTGTALAGDSDPDGDSLTIPALSGGVVGTALSGTYGVLTLNSNGSYSYSANNSSAIAGAATGSAPVDHFTFSVADGKGEVSTETLAVTIDRAPIIVSGGDHISLLAGGTSTGTALAGDSDPDGDSLTITALSGGVIGSGLSGTYGVLTLSANGSYSYSANNSAAIAAAATGSAPVDHFTFSVADGKGAVSTETLAVTIDRTPVITSGGITLSTTEGGFLSGTSGTALAGDTDPDGRALSIGTVSTGGTSVAAGQTLAGAYGTLQLNSDGSYSYSANNNTAINAAPDGSAPVDQFTFSVADGSGGTSLETLSIDVHRLPVFETGAPVTYTPGGAAITVDAGGTVSDPDGDSITSAVLYLTNGNLPGDVLSFTPQSGITGSFSNGTLTLTGTASAADYQAALQSVQYSSTDGDPYANGANPFRTVGVILTDADGISQPASALIAIDPVTIDIPAGSTTSLGTIGSTRDIVFTGTGSTLDLTSPANFAGSITGFGGNIIDITGISVASESFGLGTLSLLDGLGGVLDSLTISEPGWITSADFHLATDGNGGTDLTLCFYPGTRIATPAGETAVEDLRPGDMVLTSAGAAPLRWIGRSEIATRFADKRRSLPIRIAAGALGNGLPLRDLLLSPDHALFLDGCLIQAAALVNGGSIRREYDVPEHFTYYHVELDHHALLLAEGALAESFVDNVDRMHFHNWDERGTPATAIEELPYPRAKSARQVPLVLRDRFGLAPAA